MNSSKNFQPPHLPITPKMVFEVLAVDLDRFLNAAFQIPGNRFKVVEVEELSQGAVAEFTVTGTHKTRMPNLAHYEESAIAAWEAGEFLPLTTLKLLEEACARGWIPPGSYLVTGTW